MSRNERARRLLSLLTLLVVGDAILAHSLAVDRGTIEIHPDRTVVRLEVPLVHLADHDRPPDARDRLEAFHLNDASRSHEARLLRSLAIREESGERLAGRVESAKLELPPGLSFDREELHDRVATYVLAYSTANPPRYLSFQQIPGDGTGGPARPILLTAVSSGLMSPRQLRLTRGGNIETLAFGWNGEAGGNTDRLRSVRATVHVEERGLRLETVIPLLLLETWLSLPRADRDFLNVADQSEATELLRTFFRDLDVVHINGNRVAPRIGPPRFLGPDDPVTADGAPRTLGAWTARVAVTRHYPHDSSPLTFSVEWERFNASVLAAEFDVRADGRRSSYRLSTYEPRLEWSAEKRR